MAAAQKSPRLERPSPHSNLKLHHRPHLNPRKNRRLQEHQEIDALEARIVAGAPTSGSNPLASSLPKLSNQYDPLAPYVGAKFFAQLPISEKTKQALADAKYTNMTAIQKAALPHALCGRDVLGAAKTGSGKTLAFLIPVVEKLYRLRWGTMDGVGAIIISPTRELAVQIFEELRKVGKEHSLSGGLLIGGRKGVDMEKERVNSLNVLVCTPGRLLQHMDETPNFECSQLQMLVLDEADRILDMGFASTLNAIVAQLPKQRQTLLFSATQTRSVQDLARLSLKDPEYLAVHAESAAATPSRLQQTAIVVPLEEKLDMLWSFIKTHLRAKTLVFLSSCKQVKFVYEAFKRLRPGIPIKCLHGRMKQSQRTIVFFKFCEEKHSILFATDVAARGLDFPAVDWVVQVDCPEDVPSYIHRVGRTARYTSGGHSLIFLSPSENKMLDMLKVAKIPIKVIKVNANKLQRVSGALAGLLSKDPDLKYMAQRAFITYVRSIHIRPDKDIFDVTKLPVEEYAVSLGLPTTPRIRFLKRGTNKQSSEEDAQQSNQVQGKLGGRADEGTGLDDANKNERKGLVQTVDKHAGEHKIGKKKAKLDRLFNRKNADVLSFAHEKMRSRNVAEQVDDMKSILHGDDDDFLTRKRRKADFEGEEDKQTNSANSLGTRVTKKKRLKINPNRPAGQRLVFDEEGNAVPPLAAFAKDKGAGEKLGGKTGGRRDLESAAEERFRKLAKEMKRRDREDRLFEKRRLRERRLRQKQKLRKQEGEGGESSEGFSHESEAEDDLSKFKVSSRKTYFNNDSSDGSGSELDDKEQRHDSKGRGGVNGRKRQHPEAESLSLAEQEDLALKILKSRG